MRANFFDDYEKIKKEDEKNAPQIQTDNEELFTMESPVLKQDDRPNENEDTFYTKEEIDNLFKELLAKVEIVGKIEQEGSE